MLQRHIKRLFYTPQKTAFRTAFCSLLEYRRRLITQNLALIKLIKSYFGKNGRHYLTDTLIQFSA